MGMTDEGALPPSTAAWRASERASERTREEIKHTTQMNWSGAASSSLSRWNVKTVE